ncbi:MAG: double-strand break repair protein AddB [Parvularculaceae bacterium]
MSKNARPDLLSDAPAPRVYSIDAGRPFLGDLADALIDELGRDLAHAQIFLPTRRSLRAAADAVIDAYARRGVNAALLPRFRAIGDIEEDELSIFAGDAGDEIDLAPAISATARLSTLARFVAERDRVFAGQENWPAAVAAARELGKLIDSFHTEEIDFGALAALDVADVAEHWRNSLKFLEIVTQAWPAHLKEIGRLDAAERRARLISAMARRIEENPPAHPIVIAGSTASAPAVARLVNAIARAPIGAAVLPGLDRTMDARGWNAVKGEDAHPQSGLRALLDRLDLSPRDIRIWPKSGGDSPRTNLLTLALRPAEATDEWVSLVAAMTKNDENLSRASDGLHLIEADNEEAEASIIAALFRETVETPERTAFLITPDRMLARRVALKMRRWNIIVDDSAGVPFTNTQCGTFLRLVAAFLENPGDPVSILALLRHPLTQLQTENAAGAIDAIDRALRGAIPARGLESLAARFAAESERSNPAALAAVNELMSAAAAFSQAENATFGEMLAGLVSAAEKLADGQNLWSGADGETGASLLSELGEDAGALSAVGAARFTDLLTVFIAGAAVRARRGAHPRLAILGPLEARLQTADRVILGGLNEGVWPHDAASDPFLSRKMRADLNLASPERRIGLSAHDFEGFAARGETFLTRAMRAGGKPADPSRWIVRLKNILKGADAVATVDCSNYWRALMRRLDEPDKVTPVDKPRPKAGPGRRPAKLSVTRIERWLRDPYSIYAGYLLDLRKLEDPGAEFDNREMGNLLHRVFQTAAEAETPPTVHSLSAAYDALAPEYAMNDAQRRFWSLAVEGAFRWFIDFDAERRNEGRAGALEREGVWTPDEIVPPFTLTARADRIDILNDGRAAIFDSTSLDARRAKSR